jgi:hypothetical protein
MGLGLASQTHDLGRLYASLLRYPNGGPAPLLDRGWSNTTEPPWMYGVCLVLRLWPLRWALSVGVWREHRLGTTPLKRIGEYPDPSDRHLFGVLDAHALNGKGSTPWDC